MNLAVLIGQFPPGPPLGGAELQAEAWAMRLADSHRVTVITRRVPAALPARETRDGFEVIRLPVSGWPLVRTFADVRGIRAAIASLAPRPDVLLCFQTFVSGYAGVAAQRALGIPALVWVRGEGEYALAGAGLARWVSPGVWREARGVLVQSEENRAALLTALGRVSRTSAAELDAKLDVVPNGLELPAPPFRSGARILSVGRLIPDKGMDVVIDAVAGMQGLLTLAGDGPLRASLEARARHHGLDVRFEGFATRERLDALYRDAACVVLASRHGEGLPNVLLEAMGHARAVVATPVAGVRGLIEDGVNGLLVPVGDPLALRDALARLAHERGLAERLGAAARATAERFAWSAVRPRLETALERAAAPVVAR